MASQWDAAFLGPQNGRIGSISVSRTKPRIFTEGLFYVTSLSCARFDAVSTLQLLAPVSFALRNDIMLRQKPLQLFRSVIESPLSLDRAQPPVFVAAVQQACHGGGPSPGSSRSDTSGPHTDAFTEKLQEKGRKELESLTPKSQEDEDDWVDVRTSFVASCNICGRLRAHRTPPRMLKFVLQIKNYETGEVGGPAGSRKGAEPTRFGEPSTHSVTGSSFLR